MNSQESYQNFYDPKTLAVMDRAFAAIWTAVKADDPFRNYAHDRELRLVIGAKLLNLVEACRELRKLHCETPWKCGCPLLALSRHRDGRCSSQLLTRSGHCFRAC
jgi:hypothetical protein